MKHVIQGVLALALTSMPLAAQQAVTLGSGATLRVLDKVSGQSENYDLTNGESFPIGKLTVELKDCRYPKGNISGEAYAFLKVTESGEPQPIFQGWMVASSPALNALEHSRYDVWVLRCTTS